MDGLFAVPVDIESIDASFIFDGSAQTATADATITYTVGPDAGHPIFDLRQTITDAWLDGSPFPVSQLAHHSFGGVAFTDLRVIESVQNAGSVHILRVRYGLAVPNSQLGGSYLPALDWLPGPKLRFVFGFSDLNRARYVEAWLPANLIFDQFRIALELEITGTMAAHSIITNGTAASLGPNHWRVSFPDRFSALSPMLEVRASDTLANQVHTVSLPVSGQTVTIEAWKLVGSATNLTTEINNLKSLLTDNENGYGGYVHGNRFVAFFNGSGGMEYEGGTTTSTGALLHETFHSWFARGIKPASQADGWWDEGFTSFHDDGANDAEPFDFSAPPVLLCSRDPWQRHTPGNSYSDGSRFWRGMASLLGMPAVNELCAKLYQANKGKPLSTAQIEEFLLCWSGNPTVVDAFYRFVYGFGDPAAAPDLWLRDDPGHRGVDSWNGAFWDSPDLWVRNADDDGTSHQQPEFGQDNWFHARVRNRSAIGSAQHFVVTFHASSFAGTQFTYPADFLPCLAAKAAFDLEPGGQRVIKARWPRELVPPAGSHTCLLASIICPGDHPVPGRHVWEHNNLAQKNLTVVDLVPGQSMIVPVVVASRLGGFNGHWELELRRPEDSGVLEISLLHGVEEFFRNVGAKKLQRFQSEFRSPINHQPSIDLECGGHICDTSGGRGGAISRRPPELTWQRFEGAWQLPLAAKATARVGMVLPPYTQRSVGLLVKASKEAPPGAVFRFDLVQRHLKHYVVGGVGIEVRISTGRRNFTSSESIAAGFRPRLRRTRHREPAPRSGETGRATGRTHS